MNNGESNAPGLKYKNRHIFLHLPVPPRVPRWHARPSGTAGTARIRQVYTGRTPYSTTNVARTRPHLQERSWKRSTLKRVGVAVGSHTTLGQAARHKMCRRSKSEESGRSSSDFRTCFASSILGCERGARATGGGGALALALSGGGRRLAGGRRHRRCVGEEWPAESASCGRSRGED